MKRLLSLAMSIVMLITAVIIVPVATSAAEKDIAETGASAAEAVQWVKNQSGKAIDVDGYHGAQCVDFIMAYYDYLVGYHVSGNGCDYQWNSLPSGWSRNSTPEAGAVVVWGAGAYMGKSGHYADSNYGHVGVKRRGDGREYERQRQYQRGDHH